MKLYQVLWETDDGRYMTDFLAAESLTMDEGRKWVVTTYKKLWWEDFSSNDVYNLNISECQWVEGTDGKYYRPSLQETALPAGVSFI